MIDAGTVSGFTEGALRDCWLFPRAKQLFVAARISVCPAGYSEVGSVCYKPTIGGQIGPVHNRVRTGQP